MVKINPDIICSLTSAIYISHGSDWMLYVHCYVAQHFCLSLYLLAACNRLVLAVVVHQTFEDIFTFLSYVTTVTAHPGRTSLHRCVSVCVAQVKEVEMCDHHFVLIQLLKLKVSAR